MKFDITKEQVLAIEKVGGADVSLYLKEHFAEAFKTELEIGKWYLTDGNKCGHSGMFLLANFSGEEQSSNYGFTFSGKWANYLSLYHNDLKTYTRLATPKEVETALINELIKIHGEDWKNAKIEKCLFWKIHKELNNGKYDPTITTREIWNRNGCIYKEGVFAKPLPQEKTVVPMEKALKIIAKKMKVSPENIEIKS